MIGWFCPRAQVISGGEGPVVWFNPRYGILTKTIITILVLALTVLIGYVLVMLYLRMAEQVRQLITPY